MPEGDTIFRTAVQLRKVLEGETIVRAEGRPDLQNAADTLPGHRVTSIEARGKHLLIYTDNDHVLHSHMGMTGSWHIYRPGEPWNKPARYSALRLDTERFCVVCFSPKQLDYVTRQQLRRDKYLQRLGPDLLGREPDASEVIRRFRSQNATTIGHAVMNQTVVCGIGNVYKSEILFLERIAPLSLVSDLADEQILSVVQTARRLMLRNLDGAQRRTRFGRGGDRVWVYKRSGSACFQCGTKIEMIRQSDLARSTYFCPLCQNASN